MLDHEANRPPGAHQGANCAYCGAVLERVRPTQKFGRPSCRAAYSARRRDRRLLTLAQELVSVLKRPKRGPRQEPRRG